jgi:hypothetical protein
VPRRSSSEQIQTLGYLYQESLTSKMTWSLVVEEIRRRLARVMKISPGDLEWAVQSKRSTHTNKVVPLLEQIAKDDTGSVREIENRMVELLTNSHQLLVEVEGERRFRS